MLLSLMLLRPKENISLSALLMFPKREDDRFMESRSLPTMETCRIWQKNTPTFSSPSDTSNHRRYGSRHLNRSPAWECSPLRHLLIGEGVPLRNPGIRNRAMHHSLINAGAIVGDNCIVNSRALVEHDAMVGSHSHISTEAILNGDARIGDRSFLESNATVRKG